MDDDAGDCGCGIMWRVRWWYRCVWNTALLCGAWYVCVCVYVCVRVCMCVSARLPCVPVPQPQPPRPAATAADARAPCSAPLRPTALPVVRQLGGGRAGIERVIVIDSSQEMLDRLQVRLQGPPSGVGAGAGEKRAQGRGKSRSRQENRIF